MGSLNLDYPLKTKPSSMENPLNPQELRRQGHMMIDFIATYFQNIEKDPVVSQFQPGYLQKRLPESAPCHPESIETILQDVQAHIVPGLTHSQTPNYLSGSIAGFVGEILATGFNVVGFNWMSSPAASELESIVMDWLGEMLELPKCFLFSGNGGGVIQGTTCEAVLCTLVAARDKMLNIIGKQNIGKLIVYCSHQTNTAFHEASRIAGIHPNNFRVGKTWRSTSFSILPDMLRSMICSDIEAGLVPVYICATIGTPSTTAVDPLGPICYLAKQYDIWVHVDAAHAGSACICPEFRHFIDGVEAANSFSFNAHNCFFTTLDCCCLWVKDPSALVKSLSTNPEYLRNKATDSKQVVDYKDWKVALSRRFRALKLWLVLRSYGVEKLRNVLRCHVKMAELFEGFLAADKMFEVVAAPRNFGLVCFRVSSSVISEHEHEISSNERCINEINSKLLESVNGSGSVYMIHTLVDGMFVLRFTVDATLTKESHVVLAWKVVKEHAMQILSMFELSKLRLI